MDYMRTDVMSRFLFYVCHVFDGGGVKAGHGIGSRDLLNSQGQLVLKGGYPIWICLKRSPGPILSTTCAERTNDVDAANCNNPAL